MGELRINGKVYENMNNSLLETMAAMGYYLFRYFPQDGIIINEDSTVEAYHSERYYTGMPFPFVDVFVAEEDRDSYVQMYREIDAGAKKASVVFRLRKREEVCKVTLVPTIFEPNGKPKEVLGIIENVTEVVKKELETSKRVERLNEELKDNLAEQQAMSQELAAILESEQEHNEIIRGLSSVFYAIYQIDLEEKTFQELVTKDSIRATLGNKGDLKNALVEMVDKLVLPQTQAVMRIFNELSTMQERLTGKKLITEEYIGVTTGWSRANIIPNGWDVEGRPVRALYCTRKIGDEIARLELQDNLIKALVADYQDVYIVNMDTGFFRAYRMNSDAARAHVDKFVEGNFEENIGIYIKEDIYAADRKLFDRVKKMSRIKKIFEKRDRYSFTYREYKNGQCVYHQFQLIKPDKDSNEFISALREVDHEVRAELRHAKETKERLSVIRALSNRFEAVFFVNLSDGSAIPYHLSREIKNSYGKRIDRLRIWDKLVLEYAKTGVNPDYAEELINKASLQNIVNELEQKDSFVYEFSDSTKEESRFYQIKAVPGTSEDADSIIIGISNVDGERRKQISVQKTLQDAYAAANSANNAKTDFLANMSHDIRTPMNAIIGMTAIANTHIDDRERLQDCLKKIMTSSKHLLSLVNEVLDMSKIESGKVELEEEDFNVSDLVENLLNMVRPQIEAHKHELIVNVRGMEHEQVVGDSLRLQQLFINLLTNAIKYTPDGGKITLSLTEKKTNRHNVGFYEVTVEDNGIGMSESFMEKLFEPFARANDERIRNVQGTGLGMVISKSIVNMMGGNIEVESEPDKGTKFTVTFFLKLRETELTDYNDFRNLSVLVVDDDEISLESSCCMLEGFGIKSEGVLTYEEALGRVNAGHDAGEDYFAVILDWKMPGMDGIKVARKIREAVGDAVFIIINSAYDWSEIEQEARQAGVNAFVSKPLFKSRLEHVFYTLLGKLETQEPVPHNELEDMDLSAFHVLLVEDNELNAEIATEILGFTGIKVDVANDGSAAVDRIRDNNDVKYDIIFMDIQMPKMNGYDATRAIRNLGNDYCRSVPIIAMTANAFAEDIQAAFSAGMNEHIAKPLDLRALSAVLDKWIVAKQ